VQVRCTAWKASKQCSSQAAERLWSCTGAAAAAAAAALGEGRHVAPWEIAAQHHDALHCRMLNIALQAAVLAAAAVGQLSGAPHHQVLLLPSVPTGQAAAAAAASAGVPSPLAAEGCHHPGTGAMDSLSLAEGRLLGSASNNSGSCLHGEGESRRGVGQVAYRVLDCTYIQVQVLMLSRRP